MTSSAMSIMKYYEFDLFNLKHFMEGSLLEWKGSCPRCWSLQWSGELVPASLYKINSTGMTQLEEKRAWERSEKRKEAARKREKKENWRGSSCDTIGSVCFGWKYKGIGRTANRRPIQGRCVHGWSISCYILDWPNGHWAHIGGVWWQGCSPCNLVAPIWWGGGIQEEASKRSRGLRPGLLMGGSWPCQKTAKT